MFNPTDQQFFELAVAHQTAGRLTEAGVLYRQLLATHPSSTLLLNNLAVIGISTGQLMEAGEFARRAVAISPHDAHLHCTLGFIRNRLGEPALALEACLRAAQLEPECAPAYFGIAKARTLQGRFEEAIDAYRTALRLNPNYADAASNLGLLLEQKGDFDSALSTYHLALQSNPNHVAALGNLGTALLELGRFDEAIACTRRAMALNPSLPAIHSNLIVTFNYAPGYTAAMVAAERRRWWDLHGAPLHEGGRLYSNPAVPHRRLRLGYVSADFREHPVARHILPLIRGHDRGQFDVVCYSGVTLTEPITEKFRALDVTWREAALLSDEQLARKIQEDRIDILIDLSLHSSGNRLPVFARQPAPLQVSFAGYPGSTGLKSIACRLTDRFLEPDDLEAQHDTESPLRLPDSFWCFDEPESPLEIGPLPAMARGNVVFGCLHKFSKVNRRLVELWSRVLKGVPGATLRMLCPNERARKNLLTLFASLGIAPARVEFLPFQLRGKYLNAYRELDLILDTFPYNGHMTTCDALWMGVPVVSLVGELPVSRGGLSLLSNIGLPELAAFHEDDYVRIAIDLAKNLPRLAELRAGLRTRMQDSPLMNPKQFTRGVEDAFRKMWRQWCGQQTRAQT